MSQRITFFFHRMLAVHLNLYHFIQDTIRGSILKSYYLMMSPIYAGKTDGVKKELRRYDNWLKDSDLEVYRYCARQRKHGIAFIRIWRCFGINLMTLRGAK